MTDYEAELRRIDDDIAAIEAKAAPLASPLVADDGGVVRLLYRRFQRAALSGEIAGLGELDKQVGAAIELSLRNPDLWVLKAHIALKRHRFDDARTALYVYPSLTQSTPARLLRSDLEMQTGCYAAAHEALEAVRADDPTWDTLARLAHFSATMGDLAAADGLYAAAEDELTAKQMQTFAWLEAQRGWMHFQRGDHCRAGDHYQRAEKAYSGYWLVTERMAELTGAQGNFTEACTRYEGLYAASARPEWAHALGELHSLSGAHQEADKWKRLAYAQYHQATRKGEHCYLHYLVDLCCELAGHAEQAVAWARTDVALRSNFMTQGDLAWALYRNGEVLEAEEWIAQALASGAVSSRLYTQAGCVYSAAEKRELGAKYMRLALETNPRPAKAAVPMASLRLPSARTFS